MNINTFIWSIAETMIGSTTGINEEDLSQFEQNLTM